MPSKEHNVATSMLYPNSWIRILDWWIVLFNSKRISGEITVSRRAFRSVAVCECLNHTAKMFSNKHYSSVNI